MTPHRRRVIDGRERARRNVRVVTAVAGVGSLLGTGAIVSLVAGSGARGAIAGRRRSAVAVPAPRRPIFRLVTGMQDGDGPATRRRCDEPDRVADLEVGESRFTVLVDVTVLRDGVDGGAARGL